MTPTRSTKTFYQWPEEGPGSARRFDSYKLSQVLVACIADEVEDQFDDPLAREDLAVVAIEIGHEVRKNFGDEGKLPYITA